VTFERPQVVHLCPRTSIPATFADNMALRETLYSPNPASPALSVVFDDMDGAETASIAPSDAPSQQDRDARTPPLSTYSGSTTQGSRYSNASLTGSATSPAHCLAAFVERENMGRATFDMRDWEWHTTPGRTTATTPTTPRQVHLPVLPATLDLDRIGSQLPPLPTTIPSRLPSLLEEHESDEYLTEDDDDQSEVDSIFFVNEGEQDAHVATSNSLVDLASTNAEATEDVLGIVAMLQNALNREQDDQLVVQEHPFLDRPS